MNPDPALQEQLRSMLSKSRRSLKAAQSHLDEADFDFAASRAYFAAFYAMEAAILAQGVTCSTHGGVLTTFSERFIKSVILPSEFGAKAAPAGPTSVTATGRYSRAWRAASPATARWPRRTPSKASVTTAARSATTAA